jgi:hypothetical protein
MRRCGLAGHRLQAINSFERTVDIALSIFVTEKLSQGSRQLPISRCRRCVLSDKFFPTATMRRTCISALRSKGREKGKEGRREKGEGTSPNLRFLGHIIFIQASAFALLFLCDLLILYQRVTAVLVRSVRYRPCLPDAMPLIVFATFLKSFVSSISRNVAAGLCETHAQSTDDV